MPKPSRRHNPHYRKLTKVNLQASTPPEFRDAFAAYCDAVGRTTGEVVVMALGPLLARAGFRDAEPTRFGLSALRECEPLRES